jgi:hypothetical protein
MTGQGGILDHPEMLPIYFAPEAAAALLDVRGRVDPFSGVRDPKFRQSVVSEDRDPQDDGWVYQVTVEGAEGAQILMVRLDMHEGAFRIANISGEDAQGPWQLVQSAAAPPQAIVPIQTGAAPAQPDHNMLEAPGFEDPFEGADIGTNWQLMNEDPSRYVVENGSVLLLLSGDRSVMDSADPVNLMQLTPLLPPQADYVAELRFHLHGDAQDETVGLALRNGSEDFLGADLVMRRSGCGPDLVLRTHNKRVLNTKDRAFHSLVEYPLLSKHLNTEFCRPEGRARADAILNALREGGGQLRLIRDGWQHSFQFETRVDGQSVAFSTGLLTRFDPLTQLTLLAGKDAAVPGTGTVLFDHFSIVFK